jgi:hypothetical protein
MSAAPALAQQHRTPPTVTVPNGPRTPSDGLSDQFAKRLGVSGLIEKWTR